jgi:acyl carrier protein
MELDKNLVEVISNVMAIPVEEITPDKDVLDDLGMDSMDLIDVINQTDEFTGLNDMEINDFSECRTVQDFSDRFTELLAESVPQG